jgi:hypothetical protein
LTQTPFTSIQSFRRDAGEPADEMTIIHSAAVSPGLPSMPGTGGRWLVATVEPTSQTEYAWEIAHRALDALRQGFASQSDASATEALARGFAAANACVRAANRGESGRRRSERVVVGASAIAIDGDYLVLAHVPPSQILFSQDRMVYAIPSLHSWEPHYAGSDRSQAQPLGSSDQVHPDIFRTAIEPQDTFVLCSTNLGRAMTGLSAIEDRLRPPTDPSGRPMSSLPVGPAEHPISMFDIGAIRPAGPDGARAWVDWLDHVSTERQVPSCHAIAVTVGKAATRGGSPAIRRPRTRERSRPASGDADPGPVARKPSTSRHQEAMLDRSDRPQLLHAPVASMVTSPGLNLRQLPGAHGVSRHADAPSHGASLWRNMSPRIGFDRRPGAIHFPRWLTLSLVGLLVLTLGLGAARMRQASTAETLALALNRIDERIDAADIGNDASELGTIRGQLQTLSMRHGPSAAIDSSSLRLTAVEDRLLGRSRLEPATSLGTLPAAVLPVDRSVRLVQSNSGIYVVGAALYVLDPADNQLVELLRAGTVIDKLTVGTILDAVATRSGVAVTDGRSLFSRGSSGQWSAEAIAAELPIGDQGSAAMAIVDGQIVAIDRATGTLVSQALEGTAVGGTPALAPELVATLPQLRDMDHDGELYLLGDDDRLVIWDPRNEPSAIDVPVSPPLRDARALDIAGSGIWILDAGHGDGRLSHLIPDEERVRSFALPVSGPGFNGPLFNATDFAIDLATSQIVFVAEGALWSVPIPTEG